MNPTDDKTVIILGMHRSGTSLVAGVLQKLGVYVGEDLLSAEWTNPFGHFENRGFLALNEKILAEAGGSWKSPPDRKNILSAGQEYVSEIKQMLLQGAERGVWGWKDPRTSLTIDLYMPFIKAPYFLVTRRDENDIARSLRKREGIKLDEGIALSREYVRRIEEFRAGHPDCPFLDVPYTDMVESPDAYIHKIVDMLGLEPGDDELEAAKEFVLPRKKVIALSRNMQLVKAFKTLFKSPRHGLRELRKVFR